MIHSYRAKSIIKLSIFTALLLTCVIIWRGIFASIFTMAFSSALLAVLLLPMTRKLEKRMNRGAAAGLSLLMMIAVIMMFFGIVVPALISQIELIIAQLPMLIESVNAFTGTISEWLVSVGMPELPAITSAVKDFDLQVILLRVVNTAGGMISRITQVVIIPMVTFYFLKDREKISHRVAMIVPLKYRRKAILTAIETKRALLNYLRAHAIVSIFIGGLTGFGLALLRVNAWLALGLWVAITDFIPYFGPVLGAVPIILMGPIIGWNKVLWSIVILFIANQVEANWLPRVIGDSTGLHPVTVLIAILVGNMLMGMWGLLLSLPVLIAGKTAIRAMRAASSA